MRRVPLHFREQDGLTVRFTHAHGLRNVAPQTGHTRDIAGLRVDDDAVVEGDEGRADFDHLAVVIVLVDVLDALPSELAGRGVERCRVVTFTGFIVPYPPMLPRE
jgi:hypothetical protein